MHPIMPMMPARKSSSNRLLTDMRALGYSGPNIRPITRKATMAAFKVGKSGMAAVASRAMTELIISK